jgi:hypothetical protein
VSGGQRLGISTSIGVSFRLLRNGPAYLPFTWCVKENDWLTDYSGNDLPRDSIATLYIPGTDMNELVAYAAMRPGMDNLEVIDDHTIRKIITISHALGIQR